jgi:predicted  nucleic acid-binding Zn-ribbon protein
VPDEMDQLYNEIDALQDEVSTLKGRVAELEGDLEGEQQDKARLVGDLEDLVRTYR